MAISNQSGNTSVFTSHIGYQQSKAIFQMPISDFVCQIFFVRSRFSDVKCHMLSLRPEEANIVHRLEGQIVPLLASHGALWCYNCFTLQVPVSCEILIYIINWNYPFNLKMLIYEIKCSWLLEGF